MINNHKILLIFVVLFTIGLASTQTTLGYELAKIVSSGITDLHFRDITNPEPGPLPTLTLNSDIYRVGDNVVLTLIDEGPNVDPSNLDFAFALVGGSSLTLTETGNNTNTFSGNFILSSDTFPEIKYCEDPNESDCTAEGVVDEYRSGWARLSTTLDISNPGSIEMKDAPFSDDDFINLCFRPVLQAVEISPINGANLTSTDSIVTISYANAILLENDDIANLQMWYNNGTDWYVITPNFYVDILDDNTGTIDPFSRDFLAKTITSDPSEAGFTTPINTGNFTLGFTTSCGGGGGGGLVRPSLVVNALAGIGGAAGGGSAYSSPQIHLGNLVLLNWIDVPTEVEEAVINHNSKTPSPAYDLGYFEDFDYPLRINDKGFILSGFETTIETQTLKTNTTNTVKFIVYESEKIQHFSLYTNLRGTNDEIHESDTQILYNANQDLKVVDPNGFFENVSLNINELDGNKKEVVLEVTFAKPMEKSHILVRSWDPNLYSGDTRILDAWEIVPDVIIESPIPTYAEPEIQQLQSTTIPIWIKNNAGWWSEQQIDDSDFVAGIEYLIKNGIVNVQGKSISSGSTTEIPDWIKNNAGWWSDSLISDSEFIEALQWLIENGVIQI